MSAEGSPGIPGSRETTHGWTDGLGAPTEVVSEDRAIFEELSSPDGI